MSVMLELVIPQPAACMRGRLGKATYDAEVYFGYGKNQNLLVATGFKTHEEAKEAAAEYLRPILAEMLEILQQKLGNLKVAKE